jgi:hypothetical protein
MTITRLEEFRDTDRLNVLTQNIEPGAAILSRSTC